MMAWVKRLNVAFAENLAAAASPPDVRRRLCLAVKALSTTGLRPRFGLRPKLGYSPDQGRSPSLRLSARRGEALAAHPAAEPLR